jgi:hypothetical protein
MEIFGWNENGQVQTKLHKSSGQNDWWKNIETYSTVRNIGFSDFVHRPDFSKYQ